MTRLTHTFPLYWTKNLIRTTSIGGKIHPSVGCAALTGRPTGMTGRNDHPGSTFSEAPLTQSCESLEAFESLVGYTDHMREITHRS